MQEKPRALNAAIASAGGMPFVTSGATSSRNCEGFAGSGHAQAESATAIAVT